MLKTREYCAKGIPFIYAYNDTDLVGDEEFCYKFPNNESPIDINKVIDFSKKVSKNPLEIAKKAHQHAQKTMSWDKKMIDYVEFCNQIINS